MDTSLQHCDWSHLQSFLAVAETGSLSAAARELGHSQPTLGRHVRALEAQLGNELFLRHARGLRLSPAGEDILPAVRRMQAAMAEISLQAETWTGTATGTVRIACSLFVAHHLMPPVLADLRRHHPQISLVISPGDDSENLLFREADIAIRMYRPDQLELVARRIGEIPMGTFAARSYLDRRGRLGRPEDLFSHDIVGYDQSTLIIDTMQSLGWAATPDTFGLRCDNHPAYWQMVRAGGGIGFTMRAVGRADPLVEEIDLGFEIPRLPMWLTTHRKLRQTPRIDTIWTALAKRLPGAIAAPMI